MRAFEAASIPVGGGGWKALASGESPERFHGLALAGAGEDRLQLMKSILLEIDDELAEHLERVAPARSLDQSEFVRAAIWKALWEAEERVTADAYARQPDSAEVAFASAQWERASACD